MLYSQLGGAYLPALHLSGCMNLQGYKINMRIHIYINEIHATWWWWLWTLNLFLFLNTFLMSDYVIMHIYIVCTFMLLSLYCHSCCSWDACPPCHYTTMIIVHVTNPHDNSYTLLNLNHVHRKLADLHTSLPSSCNSEDHFLTCIPNLLFQWLYWMTNS